MVRTLPYRCDPLLDRRPQTVGPRSLSQPRSSYDFSIYRKSEMGWNRIGTASCPSPCARPLWRMDQVVCRPCPFSGPVSPNELTQTVNRLNEALMKSQFETKEGDAFLTFVISFLPPPTTFLPVPTAPVANTEPNQGKSEFPLSDIELILTSTHT
jgi:hypothetical protein